MEVSLALGSLAPFRLHLCREQKEEPLRFHVQAFQYGYGAKHPHSAKSRIRKSGLRVRVYGFTRLGNGFGFRVRVSEAAAPKGESPDERVLRMSELTETSAKLYITVSLLQQPGPQKFKLSKIELIYKAKKFKVPPFAI